MDEGDGRHQRDPRSARIATRLGRVGAVFVVLLLVAAFVADGLDLGHRWGIAPPDPQEDPAAVAPPPGLDLPSPAAAAAVAPALAGGRLDPAAVRRALGGLPHARRLGPQVSVLVAGADGRPVYSEGPRLVTPASTLKLLTCLAALKALGPEHRFTTSVVRRPGQVVLVGGGDPLLTARARGDYPTEADLTTLARQTAQALRKRHQARVRVGYDDSLFTGPAVNPWWEPDYVPTDVVSPITALWVDEGRERPGMAFRAADPSAAAADDFAALLRRQGVEVVGGPRHVTVPRSAPEVASVRSAELVEIVQHILEVSDNEGAEVLSRQVGLAEGRPGSFAGGSRAVQTVLHRLGVSLPGAVIHDGSGLSRSDRVPPRALLQVLATALDADHPTLSGLVEGLPVAGFSGSLGYRFADRSDAGLGRVRAKTGTLTGVHALVGEAVGTDGSVMTFVAVADRVKVQDTLFVRDRLDQITSALAGCACARTGE
jgi:D-alanyl-D-alanine carboxypeptidase/D-alanyl-D-alanine-endopeptidase (penicillin-binding protein 4)